MLKFKTLLTVFALFLFAGFLSAAEIYKISNLSDFRKFNGLSYDEAQNVFSLKGSGKTLICPKILKLDPAKKYRLTGDFRMKPGTPYARVYFGYVPFTEKNIPIGPINFNVSKNSFSELAKPVKKGDKVIFVKDASRWNQKNSYTYVAFDAKEDFSDLPNFKVYRIVKNGFANENGVWKITLQNPVRADFAAAVKVRQHIAGGTYIYNGGYGLLKENWKNHTGVIQGQTKTQITNFKFWPGTSYMKLVILVLNGKKESVLEFKNIKVEEVK